MRRSKIAAALACVLALVVAVGMTGCKSDKDKAADAVAQLLDTYVVPVADEEGNEPEDSTWPAADFGDAQTMQTLEKYGVVADEWHRHCFSHFGYQVGDVKVEDKTASVSVTVTNASLNTALEGAAADFKAFTETTSAEETYKEGGKGAFFQKLVDYLYARLDADEAPVVTTVTVTCTKDDDGNWQPNVSGNAELFSALYGGSNVIDGISAAADAATETPSE